MIPILLVAALACPLCTPDGRMALLAKVGAPSFDALQAPGRTLIRTMESDGAGAPPPPVVTFVREANGAARVEAAGGRTLSAPISADTFTAAARASDGLHDGGSGPVCGGRTYSVQRREGLGLMSAMQGRACHGEVQSTAERLAELALASLPGCRTIAGADPFDRLAACLRR